MKIFSWLILMNFIVISSCQNDSDKWKYSSETFRVVSIFYSELICNIEDLDGTGRVKINNWDRLSKIGYPEYSFKPTKCSIVEDSQSIILSTQSKIIIVDNQSGYNCEIWPENHTKKR